MQTQKQRAIYQQLEMITSPVQQRRSQSFFSVLKNIWNNILLMITVSDQPQISQSIDAEGKLYWRIDASRTGRSIICESEQEVRCLLEQYCGTQQVQSPDYFAPHQFLDRFRP